MAASFASVPEFAKNTLSANEFSTSFFANFTCRYRHKSLTSVKIVQYRIQVGVVILLDQRCHRMLHLWYCVKQVAGMGDCFSLLLDRSQPPTVSMTFRDKFLIPG